MVILITRHDGDRSVMSFVGLPWDGGGEKNQAAEVW